jgi:hypothetical protein
MPTNISGVVPHEKPTGGAWDVTDQEWLDQRELRQGRVRATTGSPTDDPQEGSKQLTVDARDLTDKQFEDVRRALHDTTGQYRSKFVVEREPNAE